MPDQSCLKKVSVIEMKLCTRIINVKKGFKSAIVPFTPSNTDVSNFSESFINTVTRKLYSIAIISCLKWTFNLFLQHDSFLTQTL